MMSEDEIRLIEVVKRHNVLYDMTTSEYKDHAVRDAAWEAIAKELQITKEECKERWSKLRNCFTNALKRRRYKMGRTGREMPPWKYESIMSFLLPYMQGKATTGDIFVDGHMSPGDDERFAVFEENVQVNLDLSSPPVEMVNEPLLPSYGIAVRSPSPGGGSVGSGHHLNHHSASPVNDDRSINAYGYMRMAHTTNSKNGHYHSQELDETDHFFLSMSKALKRLSAIDQARIKMDLHRAVFEAEIHQLENQGKKDTSPNSTTNNVKKEK